MKNVKRFIGFVMVLLMLFSAVPFIGCTDGSLAVTAGAITSKDCGKELTWNLDPASGTLTISGTGSMYYYSIIQGAVYQITPPWYDNRGSVRKIVISDGVTEIGNYAFYGCSNAVSVEIAGSVKKIGEKAFNGCKALADLVFTGDGLEEIGEYAFENCDAIVNVTLPDTVTSVSDGAFYSCGALEQIGLSSALEVLGKKAFYGCSSLQAIAIPEKVKVIEERTFYQCYKLRTLTLSEGLEGIGEEAFFKCGSLEDVRLPETLKVIDTKAFYNCGSLKEISVPGQVKAIGESAFGSCGSLAFLTLSEGVEEIGRQAFSGCAITSLTLPNTLKTVGEAAFMNCTKLSQIENNAKISSFGVIVFYGTKWLDEYPDNVVYLGDVLYGVKNGFDESTLKVKDGTRLIADSACNSLTSVSTVTLPASLEIIGKYAFYGCTALTEMTLSKHVSSIGQKAFMDCDSLFDVSVFNSSCAVYDAEDTLPTQAVITSFEGSTAQQYAQKYSREFRTHVHSFVEVENTPATCIKDGEVTESCVCGETVITAVDATGHVDKDGDGVCDVCSSDSCSCICHQGGFKGFLYKIMRIFWKLFRVNPICACGIEHY